VPAGMSPQMMPLGHVTTNTCTYTCTNVRFTLQVSELWPTVEQIHFNTPRLSVKRF